jgi:flagellar assembly protein FliH
MNSSSPYQDGEFSPAEMAVVGVWELPDVGSQGSYAKQVQAKAKAAPQLTVTEIEATQKQAYEEAFAQGQADGAKQGYDQGFTEGYAVGQQQGYDENSGLLASQANTFGQLMEALSEPFKILDEEVERELVKLAVGIAAQIIRREIKLDAGQVIVAVREAIKVLPLSSQKISLYVHPEDAELIRAVLTPEEMTPSWAIIDDPLITRGGCKVDTDVSHIDATIENRLAAVVATVFGGERERDKHL